MSTAAPIAPAPLVEQARRVVRREELAQLVITGINTVAVKMNTLERNIRELWVEFENLPKGELIFGCATKKEFCEKQLHRTPRAIRYMLNGDSNPNYVPVAERGEIISPEPRPISNVNFTRRADTQASNAIIAEARKTAAPTAPTPQSDEWLAMSPEAKDAWCKVNLKSSGYGALCDVPAVVDDPALAAMLAPLTAEELESDREFESTLKASAMEILPPEENESDLARLRKRFAPFGLDVKKSNHGSKYVLELTASQLDRFATFMEVSE